MADSVATKPAPPVPTAKPRATVPVLKPSPVSDIIAREDAKFLAAVEAAGAVSEPSEAGTITRAHVQEATNPAINPLPPAQTAEDLEREVELRLHGQLHFISTCPPDTMTVNDFAEHTKQSTSARAVLDQYIEQGWVSRNFREHYGRYSLTPAGLDYLVELARKHDLPR